MTKPSLSERIAGWMEGEKEFNPPAINDPLAAKISWKPLKKGGANFKTHKLVSSRPNRIEFQATTGTKIFALLFPLAGLYGMAFAFFPGIPSPLWSFEFILPLFIGGFFLFIGFFFLKDIMKPIVFDRSYSYFWKGKKGTREVYNPSRDANFTRLDEIHALQIIKERVRSSDSSYKSYELNLILKDLSRKNILDHGNLDSIREDAATLSEFLKVPVWDGTNY